MRIRRTLPVLLLSIALSIPAFAQSSTGSISGTVTDDSAAALPGVQRGRSGGLFSRQ